MRNRWVIFIRVIISDFFSNNCPYMAAGIAYWTLFSVFPLSLAGVSLLGYANPTSEQQERMVERIIEQIPVSADYVLDLVERVAEARGALSVVAVVGLLVSGSAVFAAIRKGINHAWHVTRPHPFFIGRGIDMLMLVFVGLLALIAATNFIGIVATGASNIWFVGEPLINFGFDMALVVASFIILAVLYRYVPYTEVEWRDVWLGALLGALMAYFVRLAFSGFLINVNEFNLVYGSLGALMALLVWVYLSALSLVLGAEVSYIYSRAFGSRRAMNSFTVLQARYGLSHSLLSQRGFVGLLENWILPNRRGQR
ncbi:MAG: YihY/virulence factor BrkB family protein [Chloroflexota bacterium]|nr:YihY/virulence factor BrkB family protein [Chloroflexota bacterium]MDE2899497.1 YihY/virulence factor BrkB family protein [Chloroflexota bacterium]MDE2970105.1 YihY/virulence factor BrkB family protein [Chloroflexota bacterium]